MRNDLRCIVMAAIMLAAIPCLGQSECPWLNVATAAGLIGSPTTLSMPKGKDHAGGCLFRYQAASMEIDLRITVAAMNDAQRADQSLASSERSCRLPVVPLTGIGNSAVLCADDHRKPHTAEVFGRVRDNVFIVALKTSKHMDLTSDDLAQKAEVAARQVAGDLF